MKYRIAALLASTAAAATMAGAAYADDAPAAPAAPASWASTIKLDGHLDAGITVNSDTPVSDVNFGRLYDDHANEATLNGIAFNFHRDVDTSSKTPDFGFKVQAVYGSDSRYTQLIGEFNRMTDERETLDVVEAHADAHLPYLTAAGMEVHAGILPTLEGIEVIDPTGNFFYSHSYIYNFGIPAKYTGLMTETHLNPMFDLYLGYDTGLNTFAGRTGGADSDQFHFHGGLGVNLKNVTILASTQIGPEDFTYIGSAPPPYHPIGVHKDRYLNDVSITWKVNDKLTSMTDLNYVYDEGAKAAGYGVAQYFTYQVNPILALGVRGEVWKDEKNFYVAGFEGNTDFVDFAGGYGPLKYPVQGGSFGQSTTYGELTFGANIKPQGLPKQIDGMTFRPEVRIDTALQADGGFKPFIDQTQKSQYTFAIDVVAPFTLF
jgi:hypothetical protein